jgi:hypothetical protein
MPNTKRFTDAQVWVRGASAKTHWGYIRPICTHKTVDSCTHNVRLYPRSVPTPNMPPTTYKLRLDTEQLARWQEAADAAGLRLAEWIRRELNASSGALNGSGDDQPVRGTHQADVARRSTPASDRPTEHHDPSGAPQLERTDNSTHPNQQFTQLERIVAGRTGHQLGCGCFQCLQTARHFTPAAAPKPTKQNSPAAKLKGKR